MLGGTGFLGRPLVARLRSEGHRAVAAGRSPDADLRFDASDARALAEALEPGWDVVVNLAGAGLADPRTPVSTLDKVNRRIPELLGEALHRHRFRLIHAASSTERERDGDDDESDYSRTKRDGRLALIDHAPADADLVVARIHNVYGPAQPANRFVASAINTLKCGREFRLRYPNRIRDFVFQADATNHVARLCDGRMELREVDIATGTGTSLLEACLIIARSVGADPSLVSSVETREIDPHPVTVATSADIRPGSAATTFAAGIKTIVEGRSCAGS